MDNENKDVKEIIAGFETYDELADFVKMNKDKINIDSLLPLIEDLAKENEILDRDYDELYDEYIDLKNKYIKIYGEKYKEKVNKINNDLYDDNGNVKIPNVIEIKSYLDKHVIGQDDAKKVLSVAVVNHYARLSKLKTGKCDIKKSNILILGSTGCGKTELVKHVGDVLGVPYIISSATGLSATGYQGKSLDMILRDLYIASGNDIENTQKGIICIDEFDKISAKKTSNGRDVTGESIQFELLKYIEGSDVDVPTESSGLVSPTVKINTENILFIFLGAFSGIDEIAANKQKSKKSIGFNSNIYEIEQCFDYSKIESNDIVKYGFIPEIVGRIPVITYVNKLQQNDLVRILTEPENSIVTQYKELFSIYNVDLEFTEDALKEIASISLKKNIGARGLRSVVESFITDIMFDMNNVKGLNKVVITKECVTGNKPEYICN